MLVDEIVSPESSLSIGIKSLETSAPNLIPYLSITS